jgi:two-component system sensor histidine kinase QseC
MVVEINESMAVRSAMNRQIVFSLTLPLAALILLVAGIAYAQVAAAMRPMQRITADLDSRGADDMRPLAGHRIPSEIAPLFEAFNRLLDRLGRTLQREREFSQNAAHELRTPLAVLKTRAQIAARDLAGDPARHGQFDQLVAATDRATGVIDQLLVLNRLDSSAATDIDLSRLVADICRDVAPEALARAQDFGAEIAPGVNISGQPDALAMMLRNLIENAIRHTPPHGRITTTLAPSPGGDVEIYVCDSGPGIPAAEREAVFDRFTRLDTATPGSGLGLAIVGRIVEQYGGRIDLSDHLPHGLAVRVVLPKNITAA